MKTVVYDDPHRIVRWVAPRIGEVPSAFSNPMGIGIEEHGELVAGVVYERFNGASITMHVAANPGARWATPKFLRVFFAYPFIQLGCNRVNGLVRVDNLVAQRFDEHLGFAREGLIRCGCDDGTDLILYGMLRSECRFLEHQG